MLRGFLRSAASPDPPSPTRRCNSLRLRDFKGLMIQALDKNSHRLPACGKTGKMPVSRFVVRQKSWTARSVKDPGPHGLSFRDFFLTITNKLFILSQRGKIWFSQAGFFGSGQTLLIFEFQIRLIHPPAGDIQCFGHLIGQAPPG